MMHEHVCRQGLELRNLALDSRIIGPCQIFSAPGRDVGPAFQRHSRRKNLSQLLETGDVLNCLPLHATFESSV